VNIEGKGADNSDYCRIYYKVDGGAQQTVSLNNGAFAVKTVSATGIRGNSLEIIINSATSFGDEFYYITNIKVFDNSILSTKVTQANNFQIYPNPVSDMLNISFPDNKERELKFYNSVGKLTGTRNTNDSKIQIDAKLMNLKGLVMLQVICENKVFEQKFIVN